VKKKILIIVPVLLVVVGAAYKMVLAPKPVAPKKKIEGAVVPLQKEFLLNLDGGRYAKVSVALVMPVAPVVAEGATAPPLEQEAAVRAVVTDRLTGLSASALIVRSKRHELLDEIRKQIDHTTDEEVDEVLFTDITVQ
jgi:flagellar FliL protein